MPGSIPNDLRDQAIAAFREQAISSYKGKGSIDGYGWVPFPHQREWWLASEGLVLLPGIIDETNGRLVQLPDGRIEKWATSPRPGGIARVIADLGAFKIGKSQSGGFWASSFAVIPNARVNIIGLEYD